MSKVAPAPADSERLRRIAALLRELAAELDAVAEPPPLPVPRPKITPTDLDRERARASLRRLGAVPRR